MFKNLFEKIETGLVICSTDGRFIKANRFFCNLLGHSEEFIIGKSFKDITHPEDLELDLRMVQQTLDGDINNYTIQKRYIKKDKSIIWVNLTVTLIRDENDTPDYFLGTIQDISQQKKAEIELEKSRKDWKTVFQAIKHPIVLLDKEHKIVEANKAVLALKQEDKEKLTGKKCYKVFHGDNFTCPPGSCPMETLLKKGMSETIEMEMESVDGTFLVSCTPLYNEKNELQNIIHIATDITKLKNTEKKLFESEKRYKLLLDTAPVGIAVHSKGRVVFANEAGAKMLGAKNNKELINLPIDKIVHPDNWKKSSNRIEKMMNGETGLYPTEDRYLKLDGDVIDVLVTATPVTYNNEQAVQVIVMDLTSSKQIQKELNESERRFSEMMNNVNLISIMLDYKGNITFCNKYFLDLTGYTNEEIIEKNWFDIFISENLRNKTKDVFQEIIKGSNTLDSHINKILKKDGSSVLIAWNNTLLRDTSGNVIGTASIGENITQRKEAEDKLINSEKTLNYFVKYSPAAIAMFDTNMNYIAISDRFIKDFRLKNKNIIGLSHYEVFPEMTDEHKKVHQNSLNGEIVTFEDDMLIRADGSIDWVRWELRPWYTYKKVIGGLIFFAEVITDKINAKRKLQQTLNELQELYNNLDEAIFSYDVINNKMLQVSVAHESIFGYKCEKFYTNPKFWYELVLPEDKPKVDAGYPILEQGKKHNHQVRIKRGDGEIRWIEAKMKPIMDENNKIIQIDGIVSDITERKNAEEDLITKNIEYQALNEEYLVLNEELQENLEQIQNINSELEKAKVKAEESDKLKTAFLQNMSHEIRTPLNGIMGFAELLQNAFNDKEKLKLYTSIISDRSNDLLNIINDILDIAKIESGQLGVYKSECVLSTILDEVEVFFKEYKKRINKSHIDLRFNHQCDILLKPILIDVGKLKQILLNLINNAFKFTDKGYIEVGCNLESKNFLHFYVKDTGIGIPYERQKQIFNRFFQINSDTTRVYGGNGLGLSIVKGILDLLEGEIWLESELGKGSKFNFKIPFTEAKQKQDIINNKFEQINSGKNIALKILIVEDDFINMKYLQEIFLSTSCDISIAETGNEALLLVEKKEFDIIFMDIRLPDMNGYEIVKRIRKNNKKVRIIAQTAYTSQQVKELALNAGCNDYIAKPIKKEDLLILINEIYKQKSANTKQINI